MFKRGDKSDWQELVDKIENKRKMFADLLNEGEGESLLCVFFSQPVKKKMCPSLKCVMIKFH